MSPNGFLSVFAWKGIRKTNIGVNWYLQQLRSETFLTVVAQLNIWNAQKVGKLKKNLFLRENLLYFHLVGTILNTLLLFCYLLFTLPGRCWGWYYIICLCILLEVPGNAPSSCLVPFLNSYTCDRKTWIILGSNLAHQDSKRARYPLCHCLSGNDSKEHISPHAEKSGHFETKLVKLGNISHW